MANEYGELDDLKGWVNFEDGLDDTVLEWASTAASRYIDSYTGQFFYSTATTLTFVATSSQCVKLGLPIQSITTLKTDPSADGSFSDTWAASDFALYPRDAPHPPNAEPYTEVRATGSRVFPLAVRTRADRVQIEGTFGWSAVPPEVYQAWLILASRYFKRRVSPEGVAGFGEFGAVRVSRVDPDVATLLSDYRGVMIA